MKAADLLFTLGTLATGAWAGDALGGLTGAVVGAAIGVLVGIAVAVLAVRMLVAVPVTVGTIAGGILGSGIVRALCLPGTCRGAEAAAAFLAGLGSLVGVGLVVALVTRSFDEFRESRANEPKAS